MTAIELPMVAKPASKSTDWWTQTDLSSSDITNLLTYKDWYVNKAWDAFANIAKFRKDILRKVKDDYISKKKYGKRAKRATSDLGLNTPKRQKVAETDQASFCNSEVMVGTDTPNFHQKTWEIIVKTNRVSNSVKKVAQKFQGKIQEFSWQAYMEPPSASLRNSDSKSESLQAGCLFDSTDKMTQSFGLVTAATSTQTLSDHRSDVSMQFPASHESRNYSGSFPIWKVPWVDAETMADQTGS